MEAEVENTAEKQLKKKVPGIPFTKNDPRINRDGRPLGSKNFTTMYDEAIKKIAKSEDIKGNDIELNLIVTAIKQAQEGNFSFYKDLQDRNCGKPAQQIEAKVEGDLNINIVTYGDSDSV